MGLWRLELQSAVGKISEVMASAFEKYMAAAVPLWVHSCLFFYCSDCTACNSLNLSVSCIPRCRHDVAEFMDVIGTLCYEWIMEIAVIISQPDPLHVYNLKASVFPHCIHPEDRERKYQYGLHQVIVIAYREQWRLGGYCGESLGTANRWRLLTVYSRSCIM